MVVEIDLELPEHLRLAVLRLLGMPTFPALCGRDLGLRRWRVETVTVTSLLVVATLESAQRFRIQLVQLYQDEIVTESGEVKLREEMRGRTKRGRSPGSSPSFNVSSMKFDR